MRQPVHVCIGTQPILSVIMAKGRLVGKVRVLQMQHVGLHVTDMSLSRHASNPPAVSTCRKKWKGKAET